jgi:hypothetical protein
MEANKAESPVETGGQPMPGTFERIAENAGSGLLTARNPQRKQDTFPQARSCPN